MADVIPLGTNFDMGFQSDVSRDELNPRAAFRMFDYLPQMEAPVRGRGGWRYGSPDLNTLGPCASVRSMGWLPFPGDGHLLMVGDSGSVFQQKRFDGTGGALVADSGDTTIVPTWPVTWHRSGVTDYGIILGGLTQTGKNPKKYTGSGGSYTVAPLGGTPPQARMGFSWNSYLVLGNYYDPSESFKLKNNNWAFSDPLDVEQPWVLSGPDQAVLSFPEEIVAGLPLQNTILGFGYQDVHSLVGDTPPPGSNFTRKILFAGNGTIDGRSVVGWRSYAIWANNSGVWMSDGATLSDLTSTGGISVYYRQKVAGLSFVTGASAVAGIYRDHYVLTLRNQTGGLITTLVCDLARKVWTEWTNVNAACYARRAAAPGVPGQSSSEEELSFGSAVLPRLCRISSMWLPSATFAYDADGTPVQPVLETPFYRVGGLGKKRMRFIYVGYDLRPVGGGAKLNLGFTLSPEPEAQYQSMSSLPVTNRFRRKRLRLGRGDLGVGLRIAQSGPSASTRLYSIETEAHPWEVTR